MFKTVVITLPRFFEGEAERITSLLLEGKADLVHIRKPGSKREDVERLLQAIPSELRPRLTLHDHFGLRDSVGGLHLNSRNASAPEGWQGRLSRSCHSLEEVAQIKAQYDYVSLSPVFDSVSKQGYLSAFTAEQIAKARREGIIDERVFALGGIRFSMLEAVKAMGFGGAMILGDAWRDLG
ncbi:MAG: thiamine phosphate synthase [Prevotellaceae bacterium]|nr:thiamine phosphate synthase [Prevotellaceae bacterium]MCD8304007.1 thiamine phosphate synthase [Prevotellaceae bacterium]